MKTIYLNNEGQKGEGQNDETLAPSVATIGFFDGVHRGHQFLIEEVKREAATTGLLSTVITFDLHPRQVLHQDYQPELLTTLDEKLMQLSRTGVDQAIVLHFDRQMAGLSAYEFMGQVLRERLNVRRLVIGYDNRFGHNRAEGFDDYVRYGQKLGIDVIHNTAFDMDGVKVSSSVVRSFIREGEVGMAAKCLGYPYTLVGTVTTGFQEGRKLGFPTANLDPNSVGQLIPAGGVYAVKVRLTQSMTWHAGMMNIGTRPTFDGTARTLEVNIFDFEDDIYGRKLLVAFYHKVREEKKFRNAASLAYQLQEDKQTIIDYFSKANDDDQE